MVANGDLGPGEGGAYLFKPWLLGPTVKDVNLLLQCLGYPSYCIILGRTLLVNLRDCTQPS